MAEIPIFVNTGRKLYGMSGLMAVDPGEKGAIAYCCRDSWLWVAKMPDSPGKFREMVVSRGPSRVIVEDIPAVGAKMGQVAAGPAYMAYGAMKTVGVQMYMLGWIEGVLAGLRIDMDKIPPKEWQKCCGALPKDYERRKWTIRWQVSQEVPRGVTNANADALAILLWKSGAKLAKLAKSEDLF